MPGSFVTGIGALKALDPVSCRLEKMKDVARKSNAVFAEAPSRGHKRLSAPTVCKAWHSRLGTDRRTGPVLCPRRRGGMGQ